ncbi:hypothetical protein Trydic_g2608 [Trypoxylus dichotomus]
MQRDKLVSLLYSVHLKKFRLNRRLTPYSRYGWWDFSMSDNVKFIGHFHLQDTHRKPREVTSPPNESEMKPCAFDSTGDNDLVYFPFPVNSLTATAAALLWMRLCISGFRLMDATVDTSAKEQRLKNATIDLNRIQQDLESAIRARDMAYQENRRLQDDLASCVADSKRTQSELDIARRQVDDLKRQLQHYVAEVKRTEDLISQKEIERTEMLDQYRSLTQEATVLENCNHSLETEAAEVKVQLSVALDHVSDLERKIESQETMIKGYEKQISDLTSQIARMETRIVQQTATTDKLEAELESVKDLCVKLDKQKDSLIKQLDEKETARNQIDRDVEKIRRHSSEIQSTLSKERETVDRLEQLLAASRLETAEQRLLNEELQKEIKKCRDKVQELETKLITTNEQLDLYQEKALEYSQQNKQLRREVANERFYRASESETKRYPSL